MDMPGFGLTERPKGCLTGYDAEKALHNLIDALAMHEGWCLCVCTYIHVYVRMYATIALYTTPKKRYIT